MNVNDSVEKVCCCDCAQFLRDVCGRSRSNDTGEYFMGVCYLGHTDGVAKVFANKRRLCDDFAPRDIDIPETENNALDGGKTAKN